VSIASVDLITSFRNLDSPLLHRIEPNAFAGLDHLMVLFVACVSLNMTLLIHPALQDLPRGDH
jgi:hypothetical protein